VTAAQSPPAGFSLVTQIDSGFHGWHMSEGDFLLTCETCFCVVHSRRTSAHSAWDAWLLTTLPPGQVKPPKGVT
jgi:hypothetical protein